MRPRVWLALLLVAACCQARADRLVLRDGRTIDGVLGYAGEDAVEIESAGGNLRLPRSAIETIQIDSAAGNRLVRAAFDLQRGDARGAVEGVRAALARGLDVARVRAWCVERQGTIGRVLADTGPSGGAWHDLVVDLAQGLDVLTTVSLGGAAAPSSPTLQARLAAERLDWDDASATATLGIDRTEAETAYLVAMARALAQGGRRVAAGAMMERLDGRGFGEMARNDGLAQSLAIERVKHYLNRHDFAAAAALIARAERAGMVVGEATRTLFLLRWSTLERRRGNYGAALQLLDEHLAPLSPALARETMLSTWHEAREKLTQERDFEQAAALVRRWGRTLLGAEWRTALASIYRQWGEYLLDADRPRQAREAFTEFAALDPESDPSVLFARCEFRERFLALRPIDYAGAFELAQWAEREGLVRQAIEAYERAAQNAQLRDLAEEQLRLLRDRVVLEHLQYCAEWLEKGHPERALAEMEKFEILPVSRRLEPDVEKLRQLCAREIARRERLEPVHAETMFQDAQRRYYAGQTETAIETFEQILRYYPDTPAAGRTREFMRFARLHERIRRLEGTPADAPPSGEIAEPGSTLEEEVNRLLETLEIFPSSQQPVEANDNGKEIPR